MFTFLYFFIIAEQLRHCHVLLATMWYFALFNVEPRPLLPTINMNAVFCQSCGILEAR